MRNFTKTHSLEIIAFTSGFALMAFELVAARILAPYIGSSIYVWTSVIGVIIASLSLGYYVGGRIADLHRRLSDIAWLCLISGLAVATVILFYQPVLEWTIGAFRDPRAQGLVASLLLFAPTSFLLGVKGPYLAKLKVTSLERTGRSVASLSALNSVGGIAGVFIAGFILFGYIGSRETLVVIAILLIASSWLIVPKQRTKERVIASLALLIMVVVPANAPSVIDIDTPTAHYQIKEGYVRGDERKVRVLATGPTGAQSGVYADGSDGLVFWYAKELARIVASAGTRDHILVLGGGTFTLPVYLAERYPDAQIDVIEIDPELESIATNFFGYQHYDNVNLIFEDARSYINTTQTTYDIILADVYSDTSVPFSLITYEYGEKIGGLLREDGILAANVIAAPEGPCQGLLSAIDAAYRTKLPNASYAVSPSVKTKDERTNMIVAYSRDEVSFKNHDELPRLASHAYTDNYMPAERLQQSCREAPN